MTPHLKVILDEEATIIVFECDLFEGKYMPEEVIGKNWFETFIDAQDREKMKSVFKQFIHGQGKEWQTFENDIVCKSGRYKLLDFNNQLFEKDGVQYVNSIGIEHFIDRPGLLSIVADKYKE